MGVPAFFRWLTEKYPKVLIDVIESYNPELNVTDPNPDPDFETDNLYVDMNGIIHPSCFQSQDSNSTSLTEEEMVNNVTKYVERLVKAVRPRKVLFLAIDGVAPRAKMNQQRSRRFRAAEDKRMLKDIEEQCRMKLKYELDDEEDCEEKENKGDFDRNVITPGTSFMVAVSNHVKKFCKLKTKEWKIPIIFSDASIPGEGEHKIMDFIRSQRTCDNYNPNTRHVIHGLDADLIMLALATHEPYFSVLREEVILGRKGSAMSEERKKAAKYQERMEAINASFNIPNSWPYTEPLVRLSVPILREYMAIEFRDLEQYPWFDFERVIDDVVFLCFFVGNDFLPHLPSLDIREGALDFLFNVYKELFPNLKGYITSHGGEVDLEKVDVIFKEVGKLEDMVFQNRYKSELSRAERSYTLEKEKEEQKRIGKSARALNGETGKKRGNEDLDEYGRKRKSGVKRLKTGDENDIKGKQKDGKNKELKIPQKEQNDDTFGDVEDEEDSKAKLQRLVKESEKEKMEEHTKSIVDVIRLHEPGWKDRYYSDKLKSEDIESAGGKQYLFRSYLIGLCWVMKYYFSGVPSWKWFYPFHYAPFASDLKNIHYHFRNHPVTFELNAPFSPIEQLMAVLPEDSSHAVPEACRWLMSDIESPIHDFYPKQVPVDPNGKKFPWLWVVLLPFIEEERLREALAPTMKHWTKSEKKRNVGSAGAGILFLSSKLVKTFNLTNICVPEKRYEINSTSIHGTVSVIGKKGKEDESSNRFIYHLPYTSTRKHLSTLLRGFKPPKTILTDTDNFIRRPRMDNFSIANLGLSNRKSQQYRPQFQQPNMLLPSVTPMNHLGQKLSGSQIHHGGGGRISHGRGGRGGRNGGQFQPTYSNYSRHQNNTSTQPTFSNFSRHQNNSMVQVPSQQNFYSFNRNGVQREMGFNPSMSLQQRPGAPLYNSQGSTRINASALQSLRSELVKTMKKNNQRS